MTPCPSRLPPAPKRLVRVERDEHGLATRRPGVTTDITTRQRNEERQAVLADAGETLAQDLELRDTLAPLAHLVVPRLAAWCVVHGPREDGALDPVRGFGAAAFLPVMTGDVVRGVLGVGVDERRSWTSQERALSETIARSQGVALERTFLVELLRSLSEGIVACDARGRVTMFNTASKPCTADASDVNGRNGPTWTTPRV